MRKRFIVLSLVLVLGFSLHANENKGKVLLFIRHGTSEDIDWIVEKEVGVMTSMIEDAGFEVVVATHSGEQIKDSLGKSTVLNPDIKLADIEEEDYMGLIMPCMAKEVNYWHADPDEISLVKNVLALSRKAHRGSTWSSYYSCRGGCP
jgi:hypothetical protein